MGGAHRVGIAAPGRVHDSSSAECGHFWLRDGKYKGLSQNFMPVEQLGVGAVKVSGYNLSTILFFTKFEKSQLQNGRLTPIR